MAAAVAMPPLHSIRTSPATCCIPTPSVARDLWGEPGRAATSASWIADKELRGRGALGRVLREKMAGRASASESWVREGSDRAGCAMCREGSNAGKRAASRAPSVEIARCEKRVRPPTETEVALEPELFAGPTFVVSPDPSELPIPSFVITAR